MNSNLVMESNNRPTLLSMLATTTTTESIDIVDRSLLILRSKDRRTLLENSCLGGSGSVGNVHHCAYEYEYDYDSIRSVLVP